jgi:hypothetical protein
MTCTSGMVTPAAKPWRQLSAPARLLLKELAGPDLEHFGLLPGQLPDVKDVAATVSRRAWDALNEGRPSKPDKTH